MGGKYLVWDGNENFRGFCGFLAQIHDIFPKFPKFLTICDILDGVDTLFLKHQFASTMDNKLK